MRRWNHYKALIYKNSILWRRRLGGSLCEVVFTVFMLFLILLIRFALPVEEEDASSQLNSAIVIENTVGNLASGGGFPECRDIVAIEGFKIGLGPTNLNIYSQLETKINDYFGESVVTSFADDDEVNDYVRDTDYDEGLPKLCAAIIFEIDSANQYNYKYSIRFNNTTPNLEDNQQLGEIIDIFETSEAEDTNDLLVGPQDFQDSYRDWGFLQVQVWVDNAILQSITSSTTAEIKAKFVEFYLDDYFKDEFMLSIAGFLPFFMVIAFVIPVCRMISLLVQEREYRTKEIMMIMGLSEAAYWLSWITYYFVVYTVLALLAMLMLSGGGVFVNSSWGYIFLLFWLFGLSSMAFSFLVSVFFSTARSAVMLGIMFYFVGYFIIFAVDDPNLPYGDKIAASLLPQVAFSLSITTIASLEVGGVGVQSDNADTKIDNYTVQAGLLMMFADTIILMMLTWYVEQVWPKDWGVTRKWYFLFQKSYWRKQNEYDRELFDQKINWGSEVEPVDAGIEELKHQGRAMIVRGLSKKFGNKQAVNGLNLDIYEGQIFGLLGHNGAGKTTTLSMLSGMIPAGEGDMMVKNLTLSEDLGEIRKFLGVCPQQNILYGELTAKEHLHLFSVFKGISDKKMIEEKSNQMMSELDMLHFQDKQVKTLSGGQKRRVSLALALIGDSPIVMLDEPTAGMDLTARRQMWDFLKNNKDGRIMILTTHYMEEADVLGDRIAIMSAGTLRCCGSSLFLKNRYGVGYYLTIVKEPDVASAAHSQKLIEFIHRYIPEAQMMNDIHAEITFQLPMSSSENFTDFFNSLDKRMSKLKLRSYGMSVTTLEEVFLRVARGDDTEIMKENNTDMEQDIVKLSNFSLETNRDRNNVFCKHFIALIKKRMQWSKRDYKSIIFELVVPTVLVLAGLGLMIIAERFQDPDSVFLSISQYEETQSVLYASANSNTQVQGLFSSASGYDATNLGTMSINDFDVRTFNDRDVDPYRMGSIYFENADFTNHVYEVAIFHNHTAIFSAPTYYQEATNLILKNINSQVNIDCYNYPFPITEDVENLANTGDGFFAALIFSIGFAFIPAGIIALIVKEREMSVKHQHMISGVSLFAYWFSNFTWDITKHLVPTICSALLVLAFGIEAFTEDSDSYGALWLLFLLYGVCVSTFTYFTSFLFKNYATAQVLTLIFHMLCGALLSMALFIMMFFDETQDAAKALAWVLRITPSFCFGMGLINIGSKETLAVLNGEDDPYNSFDIESAGADILMLCVMSIVYLALTIVLELFESNPRLRQSLTKKSVVEPNQYVPDEDVEREAAEALNTDPKDCLVNIRHLHKTFGNFTAVEELSFNVQREECFALLGVNGAGKTTSFKMLTGEVVPSSGEAYIGGYHVMSNLSKVRELIGYCPQFDAISEFLTCKEHLELYATIKGIPQDKKEEIVTDMLAHMDLVQYTNVQSRSLSGGNKRKLSTAMALIGNPSIIFLDEPSAGMDPEARKKMWKIIGNIKKLNSAVILTTHSMEEAEALSDRLAIMVAGRLKCLGTATWIKNKFGEGFELEIKTNIPTKEQVKDSLDTLGGVTKDNFLVWNNVGNALTALGVPHYVNLITEKGMGSTIHSLLTNEGQVGKEVLASWAITEMMGETATNWLQENFTDVSLIEHFLSMYKFKIGRQEDKSIGQMFSMMEASKEELNIVSYALSQTSLEQIFNRFANQGILERDEKLKQPK